MKYLKQYNKLHKDWHGLHDAVRHHEYGVFLNNVKKFDSVLEIGLGEGVISDKLVNDFRDKVFLDIDQDIIDALDKKYTGLPYISFINSPLDKINKHSCLVRGISNVFLGHTLEHLKNPVRDLKILAKTINNKDAIYYISVPNAMSFHRIAACKMRLLKSPYQLTDQDKQLKHFRNYDIITLQKDIKRAGLQILDWGGILLKPLSNAQIEKNVSKEAIQAFIELGNLAPEYAGEIYVIARSSK